MQNASNWDGKLVRRVTSRKGHWSEGLGLVLGAQYLRKLNETPKSRTSFMHGVPVLPFRYGTYMCNNRRTSDPSDW